MDITEIETDTIERVFARVTTSKDNYLVYRGVRGNLMASPYDGIRARTIFRENEHLVIGVYNNKFAEMVDGDPLAEFTADVGV